MKKRFGTIPLLIAVIVALVSMAFSAWLIVMQARHTISPKPPEGENCELFSSDAVTYNGMAQPPQKLEGIEGEFVVVWQGWTTPQGEYLSNADAGYETCVGTQHYSIGVMSESTLVVLTENHQITVNKREVSSVTVEPQSTNPYFQGETVTYNFKYGSDVTSATGSVSSAATATADYADAGSSSLTAGFTATVADQSLVDQANAAIAADEGYGSFWSNHKCTTRPTTVNVTAVTVLPTSYYYSGSATTYYGSIDEALNGVASVSTGTVVAMQSFTYSGVTYAADTYSNTANRYTHTISQNHTIPSGVTFLVPYSASANFTADEPQNTKRTTDEENVCSPLCKNAVNIAAGVTLTSSGTITLSGVTLRSYPSGVQALTSGDFGAIVMGQNAKITSSGNINAYGYIAEAAGVTKSDVEMTAGTVTMPFVVYDLHGAWHTVNVYRGDDKSAPFNLFDMPNVQATLTCHYGSMIYALASLKTNGNDTLKMDPSMNETQFYIVAPSSRSTLFKMESGSKAVFKYTPQNGFQDTFQPDQGNLISKTRIDLYGTINSGTISMSIDVPVIGTTNVDLSSVVFPISYKINLHLHGTHAFTSSYKFMPGSSMTVHKDANVTVNSGTSLIFYPRIAAANNNTTTTYYPNEVRNTPAICQVAGTLTVKGSIGAGASTDKNGTNLVGSTCIVAIGPSAKLDLSSATALTVSVKELNGNSQADDYWGLITGDVDYTVMEIYTAKTVVESGYAGVGPFEETKAVYYSNAIGADTYGWLPDRYTITVTLNANGGTFGTSDVLTLNTTVNRNNGFNIVGVTSLSGYTAPTNSTASSLVLSHWCTDSACTNYENCSNSATTTLAPITLYAIWTEGESMTVNVQNVTASGNMTLPGGYGDVPAQITVVNGKYTLPNLSAYETNLERQYYFIGWYTDAACTTALTSAEQMTDGGTVYAKWGTKATIQFNNHQGVAYQTYYGMAGQSIPLPNGWAEQFDTSTMVLTTFTRWNCSTTNDAYVVPSTTTDGAVITISPICSTLQYYKVTLSNEFGTNWVGSVNAYGTATLSGSQLKDANGNSVSNVTTTYTSSESWYGTTISNGPAVTVYVPAGSSVTIEYKIDKGRSATISPAGNTGGNGTQITINGETTITVTFKS